MPQGRSHELIIAMEMVEQLPESEVWELMEACNNRLRVESVLRDATLLDEKRKLDEGEHEGKNS